MADVFVSYSRNDKARVAPLVDSLVGQGWSVWWDPAISPGQEFDRQIADELALAAAVLVVWTEDSVKSRWVRGEARDGADRGILVPVRFGGVTLPIDFRAFHTIDLSDGWDVGQGSAFKEVLRAIGALVARSRQAGPAGSGPRHLPDAGPDGSTRGGAVPAGSARVGICVLPLANLGGDPEQEYFSDGITGDIITELSRWRMLAVRSRSASFRYRGGLVDPMRVARDLDVRYVVEGSVRRLGDRVRVSVQLIDGETGSQVWGEKFDCAQSELFAVQDQVVQTIAGTLVGRVQMTDAERARRKPPSSLAAYECVQRGNALPWDDPRAAADAEKLFEQAIALDPGYAIAYALLGTMRVGRYRNDPADATAALDEAYALTKRAVELDDGDSTCHSLLAHACLYRRSYELALQHMRRSVELNPNNAWNMADMGLVLTYAGPAEDALAMFEHIPLRTVRSSAYMAACHARLGHDDRARELAAECLAGNPSFSVGQFMSKEPFRISSDAVRLAESLRMAGLPE